MLNLRRKYRDSPDKLNTALDSAELSSATSLDHIQVGTISTIVPSKRFGSVDLYHKVMVSLG